MSHPHAPNAPARITRVRLIAKTAALEASLDGYPARAAKLIARDAADMARLGVPAGHAISTALAAARNWMAVPHDISGHIAPR